MYGFYCEKYWTPTKKNFELSFPSANTYNQQKIFEKFCHVNEKKSFTPTDLKQTIITTANDQKFALIEHQHNSRPFANSRHQSEIRKTSAIAGPSVSIYRSRGGWRLTARWPTIDHRLSIIGARCASDVFIWPPGIIIMKRATDANPTLPIINCGSLDSSALDADGLWSWRVFAVSDGLCFLLVKVIEAFTYQIRICIDQNQSFKLQIKPFTNQNQPSTSIVKTVLLLYSFDTPNSIFYTSDSTFYTSHWVLYTSNSTIRKYC